MDLLLHSTTAAQLASIGLHPGGTWLLHGQAGTGKRTAAKEVARQLNCMGCGDRTCRGCQMVAGNNHPDVLWVVPDEKSKIGMEQIQQLQHDLRYKQYEPIGQRIVIIEQADGITLPAQNALLKTLEEPPEGTTVVLTTTSLPALLPTVLSRCLTIHFPPIEATKLAAFLMTTNLGSSLAVEKVVGLSQGAVGKAISLLRDPEAFERQQLFSASSLDLLGSEKLLERLQIAASMAADPENREDYLQALTAATRGISRQNTILSTRRPSLKAIEQLRLRLAANVAPKTAFEAFAVEVA